MTADPPGDSGEPLDLPPGEAPAADREIRVPRFCRKCGAPWDPAWTECGSCGGAARLVPPPPAAPPAPAAPISRALSLYFALLATSAGGIIAIRAGSREVDVEIAVTVIDSVLIGIWSLSSRKALGPVLDAHPSGSWCLAGAGLAFLTFGIAFGAVEGLVRWLGLERVRLSDDYLEAGLGWGAVIASICLQPAVFEELAFRGIIFSCLRDWMGEKETVLVSALLFMMIHLSVPSFPHLFLMGLALGYLRSRTGSLYAGMVLHFTHNLLAVLSEALLGM